MNLFSAHAVLCCAVLCAGAGNQHRVPALVGQKRTPKLLDFRTKKRSGITSILIMHLMRGAS